MHLASRSQCEGREFDPPPLHHTNIRIRSRGFALAIRATCILSVFTRRIDMALSKKKRVGKRTISAKQVRKTASGRKRHKSDGTQPPKAVPPKTTPATS
jgi:hypothetical protein